MPGASASLASSSSCLIKLTFPPSSSCPVPLHFLPSRSTSNNPLPSPYTTQHLPEHRIKALCDRVRSILIEESNVQPVQSPVTVCGDIHGQFWDVVELLRQGGMVPGTSYVFMGQSKQGLG